MNSHNAFLKSRLNLIVAVIALASISNTVFAQTPLKIERDIVFDAAHQLKADIFHPAGKGTFPAIVLVHGGGWTSGNKAQMDVFGKRFAQEGWVAVSIEYRLVSPAKGVQLEAPLSDVTKAVAVVRNNAARLNVDPRRVAILGGSAGGHLAAMVAANPASALRGAVILWGPSDLTVPKPTMRHDQLDIVTSLLGKDYSPQRAQLASPVWRISPRSAPNWLLIHGGLDTLVPPEQSRNFTTALKRNGVNAQYLEFPSQGHGLNTLDTQEKGMVAVVQFFKTVFR